MSLLLAKVQNYPAPGVDSIAFCSISMTLTTILENSPLANSKLLILIASNETMELHIPYSQYRHDNQLLDLLSKRNHTPPRRPSTTITALTRSYLLLLSLLPHRGLATRFRLLQPAPHPHSQHCLPCLATFFIKYKCLNTSLRFNI